MKFSLMIFIAILFTSTLAISAEKSDVVSGDKIKKTEIKPKPLPSAIMTQVDFAREIINSFGWGDGLSENPNDRDYLMIMDGRRTFKFEAEKVYSAKTDDVSIRKSDLLGPFSGESWLGGITVPTKVRMKVYIPVAGKYLLSAAAKGDGQIWNIAGESHSINSGNSLALTKITELTLKPGELELELIMPPEGGLDYIVFAAPDYRPIEPYDGWRFSETLTNATVAYVFTSMLGLEDQLPVDNSISPVTVIASELPGLPTSVSLSDIRYYGKISGKLWVKTLGQSAEVLIPFTLQQNGTYDLKLRFMGNNSIADLDGNQIKIPGSKSFDWVNLGLQHFSQGKHNLKIKVPPFGGIDAMTITSRKSSPEAYMNLVGITGDPKGAVTYSDMERYLSLLRKRFTIRKQT